MVSSVSYSPDGYNIASGSQDGTVRIFDVSGRDALQYILRDEYSLSSGQLLLLYVLSELYDGTEIQLAEKEEVIKHNVGMETYESLDLVKNYRRLPVIIQNLLRRCLRVIVPARNPIYEALGLITDAPTPYEILGIYPDANFNEARSAYHRLTSQWQSNPHPIAPEVLKVIQGAYDQIRGKVSMSSWNGSYPNCY